MRRQAGSVLTQAVRALCIRVAAALTSADPSRGERTEWPTRRAISIIPTRESYMENQHEKIIGYRDLTQEEIDLMNEGKAIAVRCGDFINKLESLEDSDKRCVALGKTNLQQGFMWAIRGIARPETF